MNNVFQTKALRRGLLGGVATAGAAALLIPTLPALAESSDTAQSTKKTCEVTILDEGFSRASAIDSSGSWILGMNYDNGKNPSLWNDGEAVDINLDAIQTINGGVNSEGTIAGAAYLTNAKAEAIAAEVGEEAVQLEQPDDESNTAWAYDINDDGVIVGVSLDESNDRVNALMWPALDEAPVILERPEDSQSASANAIGEDGTIVGTVTDADGVARPWVWDAADGTGEMLPDTDDISAGATAVAGDFIVGRNSDTAEPLMWRPNSDGVEAIDAIDTIAGVNPSGEVVGTQEVTPTLITSEGEPIELPGLFEHDGQKGESTSGIDHDGRVIAGTAVDEDGVDHLVQWDCA